MVGKGTFGFDVFFALDLVALQDTKVSSLGRQFLSVVETRLLR